MKHIEKRRGEPHSLTRYKLDLHKPAVNYTKEDFDGFEGKDDIREWLLEEQGYICCYCMKTITINNMRIEHFKPQSKFPELRLDYSNMLGACDGNNKAIKEMHCCDKSKDDDEITINPLHINCESTIGYEIDGTIFSTNDTFNTDLKDVLKLNLQNKKDARRGIIESIEEWLTDESVPTNLISKRIKSEINRWSRRNADGKFEKYCQVVVYYLNRKLEKLTT